MVWATNYQRWTMNKWYSVANSHAFRTTSLVGITVLLFFSVMHAIVIHSIEQHFTEQDASELNEVYRAVDAKLKDAASNHTPPSETLFEAVSGHHGVYYHVENADGETLFSSEGADFSFYPENSPSFATVTPDNLILFEDTQHMLRATKLTTSVNLSGTVKTYTVIVASNMEFHMSYMEDFKKTLWLFTLCAAIVTILAARIAIHRGHSPLRKLSRKIETISADHLDARLSTKGVPSELTVLVDSFNTMIQKLEDGFSRLSFFSADIAHELRTPITNLTTQTQVILSRERTNENYTDILYSHLEEYERMSKMVSDMLLLAQTEHGLIKPNKDEVAVNQEIKDLMEYFEVLADDKNIKLTLIGPPVVIVCDKTMLRQALSNLISNAIRYSPKDDEIVIATKNTADAISISIINHGEVISKEHLGRLFDRFYRTDFSRKRDGQGAGLGLTIAKSIIKINGGDIHVESSTKETCFTIKLFN